MAIDKIALFEKVQEMLTSKGFRIDKSDAARPWGGFFVIDESQAQEFADEYFGGMDVQELRISGKLSPKILIVAPEKDFHGNTTTVVPKSGVLFKVT
jgi:hypothetical protein